MTPEYLNQLADLADPDELWRRNMLGATDFTEDERRRLDTGIALRRYATHTRQLERLAPGESLAITPLQYGHGVDHRVQVIPSPARKGNFSEMTAGRGVSVAQLSESPTNTMCLPRANPIPQPDPERRDFEPPRWEDDPVNLVKLGVLFIGAPLLVIWLVLQILGPSE